MSNYLIHYPTGLPYQIMQKNIIFPFKCFYIWQTCTFIVYLYDFAVTTTILNLFTKILTVFFQMPIFGVVEI